MPRNLFFTCPLVALIAANPAWAESASDDVAIACYRASGPDGLPKKFCESDRIVTVGPLLKHDPISNPSAEVIALHREAREGHRQGWELPTDMASPNARWAGFSTSVGLGGTIDGHRPLPILDLAARVDVTPIPGPWLVGLEVGHEVALGRHRLGSAPAFGVTRLAIRGSLAVGDRWTFHIGGGPALANGAPGGTRLGWTAGVGLAYALDSSWALTLDARFTRIDGRARGGSTLPGQRIDRDRASILGGVTYRFLGP